MIVRADGTAADRVNETYDINMMGYLTAAQLKRNLEVGFIRW